MTPEEAKDSIDRTMVKYRKAIEKSKGEEKPKAEADLVAKGTEKEVAK